MEDDYEDFLKAQIKALRTAFWCMGALWQVTVWAWIICEKVS